MFIDTHCHLNIMAHKKPDELLQASDYPIIAAVIDSAYNVGVKKIINVGTSIPESKNSLEIAQKFDSVYASVGVHPCDCNAMSHTDISVAMETIAPWLNSKEHNKIVALGETGLDFYHNPYDVRRQTDSFVMHIEQALEHKLPLIVHVREAGEETLRVLEPYVKNGVRGVIHCFSQNKDFATTVLEWGFYCGLDAPIGYPKNQGLRDVIKDIPLEHIVLETDAPFLPPQQFRGRQNSPVYIPLIAQMVAEIKGVDVEMVERVTTENALNLFGLKD